MAGMGSVRRPCIVRIERGSYVVQHADGLITPIAPVGSVDTYATQSPTLIPGATSSLVMAPMSTGSGDVVTLHSSVHEARVGAFERMRTV